MKLDKKSLFLYAVTDSTWVGEQTLLEQVEEALAAGTTFLQLREKNLDTKELIDLANQMKVIAHQYQVPFVINDNIEVTLQCNADGVHVGQSDMEAGDVRELLGPDKILGVSAQTVEQAKLAQARGADYLGVGAVFSTTTKLDAAEVSFETLRDICNAVTIPVIAIGGIAKDNIKKLKGTGVDGVAVVSAIFAAKNITKATKDLLKELNNVVI